MNQMFLPTRVNRLGKCLTLTLFDKVFFQSMFNQNRIYRVFQLINFLKAKPAKSIRSVMQFLDTSERTVYRYLDMLKDLGFRIEKDSGSRIWISSNGGSSDIVPFTEQEADYLEKLIKTSGKSAKISESVLQKVRLSSELQVGANLLFKAHLGQIVEQISIAIVEGRQLLIKNYTSANSQTVSDRIVEPMCFTDDYDSVSAFEVKTKQNKYFNIERITEAVISKNGMKFQQHHKYSPPDVFGFSNNGKTFKIDLTLSLRAAVILKEEYPLTSTLIKKEQKGYRFRAEVYDLKPVTRFVLGFMGEIKVNGSPVFKKHFKEKLTKMIK